MRPITFCCLLLSTLTSYAQLHIDSTLSTTYRSFTGKVGSTTFRDDFISPLRYDLVAIGLEFQHQKLQKHKLSTLLSTMSFGIPSQQNTLTVAAGEINLYYAKQYNILRTNTSSLFLGGFTGLNIATRFSDIYSLGYGNNEVSVDAGIRLGLAISYWKSMEIFHQKVQFRNFFMMPLVSVLGRSGYAHDAYFKEELWRYLADYIYVGGVNKYFFFTNRCTLYFGEHSSASFKHPHRKTAWRVGIEWGFRHYTAPSELSLGNTSLTIGKVISF